MAPRAVPAPQQRLTLTGGAGARGGSPWAGRRSWAGGAWGAGRSVRPNGSVRWPGGRPSRPSFRPPAFGQTERIGALAGRSPLAAVVPPPAFGSRTDRPPRPQRPREADLRPQSFGDGEQLERRPAVAPRGRRSPTAVRADRTDRPAGQVVPSRPTIDRQSFGHGERLEQQARRLRLTADLRPQIVREARTGGPPKTHTACRVSPPLADSGVP